MLPYPTSAAYKRKKGEGKSWIRTCTVAAVPIPFAKPVRHLLINFLPYISFFPFALYEDHVWCRSKQREGCSGENHSEMEKGKEKRREGRSESLVCVYVGWGCLSTCSLWLPFVRKQILIHFFGSSFMDWITCLEGV